MVQGVLLPDGAVAVKWIEGAETWWTRLGDLACDSAPAVLTDSKGDLWVFVRDTQGEVYARTQPGGGPWTEWQRLGDGRLTDGPTACLDREGRICLFGRGLDGALYLKRREGDTWLAWESLGGVIKYAPAPVLTFDGRLAVFAVGADDAIWHLYQDGGWNAWSTLGGGINAAPAAVVDGSGILWLFGRGLDNGLWERRYDLEWTPWSSLGGGLDGGPVAAADRSGRKCVRVVGTDGATIHERIGITHWSAWAAVDALPTFPDLAAEQLQRKQERDALLQTPVVRSESELIANQLRLMISRAIVRATDPGPYPSVGEWEDHFVLKYQAMAAVKQQKLSDLAHAEVARLDLLRAQTPEAWAKVELKSAVPLGEQLAIRAPGASVMVGALINEGRVRAKFEPQEKGVMSFRIHSVYCDEETNEIGDDSIVMSLITMAPGKSAIPHGPHELGDFAKHNLREYGPTDARMNHRWSYSDAPTEKDTFANPFHVFVTLIERDGDLDTEVLAALSVAVVAGATAAGAVIGAKLGASLGGGVGAAVGTAVGAAIMAAWTAFSFWWKDQTQDEVGPMHELMGYRGMPDANLVQTAVMEWDGGRYHVAWSYSPGEPVNFLDNLPSTPTDRTLSFKLVDKGPFTQIGAAVGPNQVFGLWARRPDGTVLYRASPDGAWAVIADTIVSQLDNGWALIGGSVGKFNRETSTYDLAASRIGDDLGTLARPSFVAGHENWTAWAIIGGQPYQQQNVGKSRQGANLPVWKWTPIPAEAEFDRLFVAPGDAAHHVWAISTSGVPFEWSPIFTPRPTSFELGSLCVSQADYVIGISKNGPTYVLEDGNWIGFSCVEAGTNTVLTAMQMRHVGAFKTSLFRRYLLTPRGHLYVCEGPTVA
jgi:hypothetical protein